MDSWFFFSVFSLRAKTRAYTGYLHFCLQLLFSFLNHLNRFSHEVFDKNETTIFFSVRFVVKKSKNNSQKILYFLIAEPNVFSKKKSKIKSQKNPKKQISQAKFQKLPELNSPKKTILRLRHRFWRDIFSGKNMTINPTVFSDSGHWQRD